jgi:hypothetical protein
MHPDVVMEFKLQSAGTVSTYRIISEEDPELHLDLEVRLGRWEGLEVMTIQPGGDGVEEAILDLVKIALRDSRA